MKNYFILLLATLHLFVASLAYSKTNEQNLPTPHSKTIKIAIIIDDLGFNYGRGKKAINLPANFTYAIIPHSPYGQDLAQLAHINKKEIMLHIPMEGSKPNILGKGALTSNTDKETFIKTLKVNLDFMIGIKGVNNHMGSKLTKQNQQMDWLMSYLSGLGLYFVDSKTTTNTVTKKYADIHNIPHINRDVFLDHDQSEEAMEKQFSRLIHLARKHGQAIGIGHPHPSTTLFLSNKLIKEKDTSLKDIEFVYVSELIRNQEIAYKTQTKTEKTQNNEKKHRKTTYENKRSAIPKTIKPHALAIILNQSNCYSIHALLESR